MVTPKHILGTFDEALASLRNNVLMMSSLTERSLERAMKGLFDRDDDICAHAIADDEEIDQLEIQIDKEGVAILLRFQPIASGRQRAAGSVALPSLLKSVFCWPLSRTRGQSCHQHCRGRRLRRRSGRHQASDCRGDRLNEGRCVCAVDCGC